MQLLRPEFTSLQLRGACSAAHTVTPRELAVSNLARSPAGRSQWKRSAFAKLTAEKLRLAVEQAGVTQMWPEQMHGVERCCFLAAIPWQ